MNIQKLHRIAGAIVFTSMVLRAALSMRADSSSAKPDDIKIAKPAGNVKACQVVGLPFMARLRELPWRQNDGFSTFARQHRILWSFRVARIASSPSEMGKSTRPLSNYQTGSI